MAKSEVAWLIERRGPIGPEWFFCREKLHGTYTFGWSSLANEAVKFETRSEADAWRKELARMIPALVEDTTFITEHEWVPQ